MAGDGITRFDHELALLDACRGSGVYVFVQELLEKCKTLLQQSEKEREAFLATLHGE